MVDNGKRETEPPGGRFVTDLAAFLRDMRGANFSAALQINGIGKHTSGSN